MKSEEDAAMLSTLRCRRNLRVVHCVFRVQYTVLNRGAKNGDAQESYLDSDTPKPFFEYVFEKKNGSSKKTD